MKHTDFIEFKKSNKVINTVRKGEMMYVRHFNSSIEGSKVTATLEDVYLDKLS